MELKLGKMTNNEIANWFGYSSVRSFTNKKTEKLEELRWYCDFSIVRGGIQITKIRHKEYMRNQSKIGRDVRERLLDVWPVDEPHTCAQVGALLFETKNNDGQLSTYIYQTRKQRTEIVGKPSRNNPYCYYTIVKAYRGDTEGTTRFEKLTEAERDIQMKIWKSYFNEDIDMVLMTSLMADGKDDEIVRILKEEVKFDDSKWKAYTQELAIILHCDYIVRATVVTTWTPDAPWGNSCDAADDDWLVGMVE